MSPTHGIVNTKDFMNVDRVSISSYIPSLQGVLLAYSGTQLLGNSAAIRGDCPFAICRVGFDATVWCPRTSMKLGEQRMH